MEKKGWSIKVAILLLTGGVVNRGAEHAMIMLAEDLNRLGIETTIYQAGKATNNHQIQIQLPFMPNSHKSRNLWGKILERLYLDKRSLLTLWFSILVRPKIKNFDVVIPTDGFWEVLACKIFKQKKSKLITVGLAGIGWTDADTLRLGTDVFIALSVKAMEWAKTINAKVKIVMIPLQIDIRAFRKAEPAVLTITKPIVLVVGALTKYKRIDWVIRAIALIPKVFLIIVGDGEEHTQLVNLAKNLIPNRYRFLSLAFEELPGLYKSCDVFTLISDSNEAFGMVFLEAMAANLPIVTTNDSIRKDIIGKQGWYLSGMRLNEYKDLLVKALQSEVNYDEELKRYERLTIAKQYQELICA